MTGRTPRELLALVLASLRPVRGGPVEPHQILRAQIKTLQSELAAVRSLDGLWIIRTLRRPGLHRAFALVQAGLRSIEPSRPPPQQPRSRVGKGPHRLSARWLGRLVRRMIGRDAPRFRLRPLSVTGAPGRARGGRRLICVSHVLPHPPRAGNEYRLLRLLKWLLAQGWDVLLVICPLPGEEVTDVRALAAEFPNLIVCRRDGTLEHQLSWTEHGLGALGGRRPRHFASRLGEIDVRTVRSRRLLEMQRSFCPDVLIELLLHLEQHFDPEVLLAEYVFMTRPFPLLRPTVRKVLDTIDVFSNKQHKVVAYGVPDALSLSESEEASLLNRADLLIAIQPDEAADLRRLAPRLPIILVGVDFDVAPRVSPPSSALVILFVGSGNLQNVKGLRDFLRFAWPLVRREVPGAELRVVGAVGAAADVSLPGVHVLGMVADLAASYAGARLVINPAVAGTGLKIKTVEALCHFRPIVLWPCGVEGIEQELQAGCHIATDWFDFSRRVIQVLLSTDDPLAGEKERDEWVDRVSAPRVYAALRQALDAPRAS